MTRGIFLTVKDLMRLTGSNSYEATRQLHKTIRNNIVKNKRKLTIKEYCKFEGIDYQEVMEFLKREIPED